MRACLNSYPCVGWKGGKFPVTAHLMLLVIHAVPGFYGVLVCIKYVCSYLQEISEFS